MPDSSPSGPRIAPLDPPYPPEGQARFERIMPPGMPPLLLFRTLAASPRAWSKFRVGSLLDPGPLAGRDREIVIARVCALSGCEYEWGVHAVVFDGAAGLSDEVIEATVSLGSGAEVWGEKEKSLLLAAEALHEHSSRAQQNSTRLPPIMVPRRYSRSSCLPASTKWWLTSRTVSHFLSSSSPASSRRTPGVRVSRSHS